MYEIDLTTMNVIRAKDSNVNKVLFLTILLQKYLLEKWNANIAVISIISKNRWDINIVLNVLCKNKNMK